mgnify:CR=1 FL=1
MSNIKISKDKDRVIAALQAYKDDNEQRLAKMSDEQTKITVIRAYKNTLHKVYDKEYQLKNETWEISPFAMNTSGGVTSYENINKVKTSRQIIIDLNDLRMHLNEQEKMLSEVWNLTKKDFDKIKDEVAQMQYDFVFNMK